MAERREERDPVPVGQARAISLPAPEGWPLAWRLLVPLAGAALVLSAATTFALIRRVSALTDRELDARLIRIAEGLAAGDFSLDGELLSRARAVTGVEALTLSPEGVIAASTLPPDQTARLFDEPLEAGVFRHVSLRGERHRLVAVPVRAGDDGSASLLAVAASTSETDRWKKGLAWTIVASTGGGLLVLFAIGHLAVRATTRPLGRLAEAARHLGQDAPTERPVPGGGGREIDVLAAEFNAMVVRLDRSREELLRAERLAVAGRMAASLAHEIRNPLSSIRMNLQLLRHQARLGPELDEGLKQVLDEVDRLELVLGNFLDLTVPSRLPLAPGDVNAAVRSTLQVLYAKLEHTGVRVELRLDDDLPLIPLDVARAKQVFLNVVLNGAEAMPHGGTLRVASRRVGDLVEVSFTDTGTGVPAELADRVCEPFVSGKPGGTGLGLHVARNIVEMHGGRLRLEPAHPGGTRCVLELPMAALARTRAS